MARRDTFWELERSGTIYADGIIFGATTDSFCEEFAKLMGSEFEMSMLGELNVFLGLQVKHSIKGTCISQQKCIKELLKSFDMEASKGNYWISTLSYCQRVRHCYLVNKKNTSGMAHFLGSCFISWGTRKQNSVALSIVEAKYIVAASCSITVDQATIGRFWGIH
ncbi:uncharacterized protein [Nicotiana sylvestris]|uniref:uncharacterized protein n=1 Tax=Nicotiana sylvestris TaxID=4096 RepID=UPI00388CB104